MVVAQERYDHYSLPEEESRESRRPKRSRLPRKGKYTLTGLVFLSFCTGLLIVFYYSQVLVTSYRTYSLDKEMTSLRQETVSLEQQVDSLNSLDRIEYVATTRLKMVKPGSQDVVLVKADWNGKDGGAGSAGTVAPPDSSKGENQAQAPQNDVKSRVVQAFASLMGIKGS